MHAQNLCQVLPSQPGTLTQCRGGGGFHASQAAHVIRLQTGALGSDKVAMDEEDRP